MAFSLFVVDSWKKCFGVGGLAEGGGVWGDGGAADDYLVATENHVDECRNVGYVDHAVVDDVCQFQVEWIWIFA